MSSAFLLHHTLVTGENARPLRWMFVLHGIFGSGGNFRSFVRRLASEHPDWGFILVDLRMHGLSQGALPPHSLEAAAGDLLDLERHLELPVDGILGHSFGGKVTLAYLQRRPSPPGIAFVLDASPSPRMGSPRAGETGAILNLLGGFPWPLPSREDFLERVVAAGHSRLIADWLAMNVRRDEAGGFTLRLDLKAIGALLESYFGRDLWDAVSSRRVSGELHLVLGGKSQAFGPEDRARVQELTKSEPRLRITDLPEAGHWVHVDDPEGVFAVVSIALSRMGAGRAPDS